MSQAGGSNIWGKRNEVPFVWYRIHPFLLGVANAGRFS
jgi:hypothetical protein